MLLTNWKLKNKDFIIDATVPGDITVDLYTAGKIPDPYFGFNHNNCSNECINNYTYFTTFDMPEIADTANKNIYISFNGIDLFAEIYLNGTLLGKTDNMFKAFKFDISDVVKRKGNVLEVQMLSTIVAMEKLDCKNYFGVFNTPRVLLRKKQCDFGWDWAANIPGYGIWKDVVISCEAKERIEDVRYIAGSDKKAIFIVNLNYDYRSYYDNEGNYIEKKNPYKDVIRISLAKTPGNNTGEYITKTVAVNGRKHFLTFYVPDAELWWPNGYGQQPLYNYKVELIRDGQVVSEKSGYLAYRSVALVQEPKGDDLIGYQIRINGQDIFVKGSNWVPLDCFTGAVKKEKYIKLIMMAKDANYNMLRVWGGGIYENEIFYETCDKLGIMVWQDFMFACADIPDTEETWLKNTIEECEYQIKRLRNYPSIVYWCGGNEKTGSFGSLIKCGDNFVDIVLRGMVGHFDGTRPYARQSPCSWTDVGNDKNSGETHFSSFEPALINGVDKYRKLVSRDIVPFASENSSMGPVSRQAYERFFPTEYLWPMNDMWRDRMLTNPYAAERIMFCDAERKFVSDIFGEPTSLDDFIAKGMTVHAEMIRCEIEFQRGNKGITSGFMNWMYSDMWPTGTWAVVDYYTEPKQAYYQMKRSYAPILMSFYQNKDGETVLFGVNDTLTDCEVSFRYGLKDIAGNIIWEEEGKTVLNTVGVFKIVITQEISINNAYLYIDYTFDGKTETTLYSADFWKNCNFERDYTVQKKLINEKTAEITVKANKFAKSVFISVPENCKVVYTDNYFDLEKGKEKTVRLVSESNINLNDLTVLSFQV